MSRSPIPSRSKRSLLHAILRPAVAKCHFTCFDGCTVTGPVRELLERRAADLVDYQGDRVADRLITLTQLVWTYERTVTDRIDLSEAVARNFFKLLAYKDEYEVSRLLTDPAFLDAVAAEVPGAQNLTYKLHPPVLKALGRQKKIGMRPHTHFTLRMLAKGKFLRGTFADPFGYAHVRRIERLLVRHYEATVQGLATSLTADSYDVALSVASAADLVRGYEEVKIGHLERYVARLDELGVDASDISRALRRHST